MEGGFQSSDLGVPVRRDPAFRYLGCTMRIDGKHDKVSWHNLMASLRVKMAQLDYKIPLGTKVNECNGVILARLWYHLQNSLLPRNFDKEIWSIIRPWFRKLNYNISRNSLTIPRSMGGFGLIDPRDMSLALTGKVLCDLILRYAPFRQMLHDFFISAYQGSHADLLTSRSGYRWARMRDPKLANQSIMHKYIHTLAWLGAEPDSNRFDELSVDELLSMPLGSIGEKLLPPNRWHYDPSVQTHLTASGIWVYADVLWHYSRTSGGLNVQRDMDHIPMRTVVPPSADSLRRNWVDRQHRPARQKFHHSIWLFRPDRWEPHWAELSSTIRDKLGSVLMPNGECIRDKYRAHPDRSGSTHCYPHISPFKWEPASFVFPWHIITLAGMTLEQYSVSGARTWLARKRKLPNNVLIPDWQIGGHSTQPAIWDRQWRLCNNLPLSVDRMAQLRAILLRRPRLAMNERAPNMVYAAPLDDSEDIDGTAGTIDDTTLEIDYQVDALEEEATLPLATSPLHSWVGDCPFSDHHPDIDLGGHGRHTDSALHGFFTCPKPLWKAASTMVLRPFLAGRNFRHPPWDTESMLLGWPSLPMPLITRKRLILWRAAVLLALDDARWSHFTSPSNQPLCSPLNANHCNRFASRVAAVLFDILALAYEQATAQSRRDTLVTNYITPDEGGTAYLRAGPRWYFLCLIRYLDHFIGRSTLFDCDC